MTKQEIQDLINKKIAGQGSAVDVGGALPAILNGIVELIGETPGPEPTPTFEMHTLEVLSDVSSGSSIEDVLAALKLDGETPTYNQIYNLNPGQFVVSFSNRKLTPISILQSPDNIEIVAGYDYVEEIDSASLVEITISEGDSGIIIKDV